MEDNINVFHVESLIRIEDVLCGFYSLISFLHIIGVLCCGCHTAYTVLFLLQGVGPKHSGQDDIAPSSGKDDNADITTGDEVAIEFPSRGIVANFIFVPRLFPHVFLQHSHGKCPMHAGLSLETD